MFLLMTEIFAEIWTTFLEEDEENLVRMRATPHFPHGFYLFDFLTTVVSEIIKLVKKALLITNFHGDIFFSLPPEVK